MITLKDARMRTAIYDTINVELANAGEQLSLVLDKTGDIPEEVVQDVAYWISRRSDIHRAYSKLDVS